MRPGRGPAVGLPSPATFLRSALEDGSFRPLPVRERSIPRRLGKGPQARDSDDRGPGRSGSAEAGAGTDFRGRLQAGLLWIPAPTAGPGRDRRDPLLRHRGYRKGASRPGSRPVQRRADQQDPPGVRRPGPSPRFRRHPRQHQRLHPVSPPWKRSGCRGSGRGGPVSGPIASWATRATARKRSAPGSAVAVSRTRFPSGPTRSVTVPGAAAEGAASRPSI